ncbi:cell-cycle control medial ring component [Apodospora peruviana]|uniref:Cell-cycle control medial ring component n=1 Tax=Apodospora peruviana TaxID=516989 RepID=A0AAE0HY95_9PEZI|nr:cell-cycle control medial ring component [Apodospora peruviana]
MATEIVFAKTFLAILDTKPQKITADHVEDPRNYPATTPYTLPRLPSQKPMSKPGSGRSSPKQLSSASDSSSGLTVTVKSPRNPPLEITLPEPKPAATTSILDIKTAVAEQTCLPVEKLKLLHNKKPIADSKTLKDVLGSGSSTSDESAIEFSLMVMGGAATAAAAAEALAARKQAATATPEPAPAPAAKDNGEDIVMVDNSNNSNVAQGLSGAGVLETEQFWEDLKGFLQQRIRDEKVAEEVIGKFRGVYK